MNLWHEFHGPNAAYVIDLYERFRRDPSSVDDATRLAFEQWSPDVSYPGVQEVDRKVTPSTAQDIRESATTKAVAVANLAQSIRTFGYLGARLDPLGSPPPGDPMLDPGFYGITEDDLANLPAGLVGGPIVDSDKRPENALDAILELKRIYCSTIGYDYGHISLPEERLWLRETAESGCLCPPNDPINPARILERLTQVEAFEKFLQRVFPGKTRFSIEGLDILVPVLDEIIGAAAEDEVCVVFIGMAHRGRLNVLANIHEKSFAQILAEFKDPGWNRALHQELGYTGDVKYHKGALRAVAGRDGQVSNEVVQIILCMPPNPSHLEHINPVVEGMARAANTKVDQPGAPILFPKASLPILIHGDAAFMGQGVVAETLNLSKLPGYTTSGTVHIITNNQLGFTATAEETRSTRYASDLAKGFKIPVIHVNADDPPGCIEAARIAFAYRARFQKDFLIDLIGYRRYGHNEGDEPSFSQPLMYELIQKHPPVRELWAKTLVENGTIQAGEADHLLQVKMADLQKIYENLEPEKELVEPIPAPPPPGAARQVQTGVPIRRLVEINQALLKLPEGFHLNRKLERVLQRRKAIFEVIKGQKPVSIDWATAEELAFATILEDGISIRMTGQDVIRGTFSQRHAAYIDVENGSRYIPLQHLPQAKAAFEIHNSPLSENAALAFEYGYTMVAQERLTIWEAQYGDFANTAQAIIDEFITSARAKWGQTPGLVILLPHGNEGQGPDHSSARPERFLQLAAENNLRIASPTSAAQYFHLLRRQAALLKTDPLPLIVMTPKGLLRSPLVASPSGELAEKQWIPVMEDDWTSTGRKEAKSIRRLLLCSGRVYVDLVSGEQWETREDVAILRVGQLAPFPDQEIQQILSRYPVLAEIAWVQEEPANMGAWEFIRPKMEEVIDGRWSMSLVARPPSSSPAEGSTASYGMNQKNLIRQAFKKEINPTGTFPPAREKVR